MSAALAFGFRERRRAVSGRLRRFAAVGLLLLALFPCVSASDDLFRFSFLRARVDQNDGLGAPLPETSQDKAPVLALLLEALDHYDAPGIYTLAFAFTFFGLALLWIQPVFGVVAQRRSGRAPPAL